MAPSQLKRLRTSLREQGITGPSKSKKQKKKAGATADQRAHRNATLQSIRDSFNVFEVKAQTRPQKFQSVSYRGSGKDATSIVGRPGVTKSMGEEAVRLRKPGVDVRLRLILAAETEDVATGDAEAQQSRRYSGPSDRRE